MASIAVLPILIGLAVDYAIQFQARYDEAVDGGPGGRRGSASTPPPRGGPTIGTACLATGAGFLALLLSPTPMVRSFGLLLVVGIADRLRACADRRLRGPEPAPRRRGRGCPDAGGRGRSLAAGLPQPATGPACRALVPLP